MKAQISRPRHTQLAKAFRGGRTAMARSPAKHDFEVKNPYAVRNAMPDDIATVQGAMLHAFEAGKLRQLGMISDAGTLLRNARYCMRRATERGQA